MQIFVLPSAQSHHPVVNSLSVQALLINQKAQFPQVALHFLNQFHLKVIPLLTVMKAQARAHHQVVLRQQDCQAVLKTPAAAPVPLNPHLMQYPALPLAVK